MNCPKWIHLAPANGIFFCTVPHYRRYSKPTQKKSSPRIATSATFPPTQADGCDRWSFAIDRSCCTNDRSIFRTYIDRWILHLIQLIVFIIKIINSIQIQNGPFFPNVSQAPKSWEIFHCLDNRTSRDNRMRQKFVKLVSDHLAFLTA